MLTNDQIVTIAKTVAIAVAQSLIALQAPTQQPTAVKQVAKSQPKAVKTTDRKVAFANQVVTTFALKGIKVTPNVDVLTFGKWEALGFRPKTGQHATFVKTKDMNGNGIALFHKEQVERIAA